MKYPFLNQSLVDSCFNLIATAHFTHIHCKILNSMYMISHSLSLSLDFLQSSNCSLFDDMKLKVAYSFYPKANLKIVFKWYKKVYVHTQWFLFPLHFKCFQHIRWRNFFCCFCLVRIPTKRLVNEAWKTLSHISVNL